MCQPGRKEYVRNIMQDVEQGSIVNEIYEKLCFLS